MPAERIAANLAFINWTVLTGLAVGSFGAVVLARLRTDATRGFMVFTAFCAVALGALALASDLGLPRALAAGPVVADPTFDVPRRVALGAFCALGLVTVLALMRGARATGVGVAGGIAGLLALVGGALTWGGGAFGGTPLAIQLIVLAAVTGGVFAAMILGHWYLVTPRLPEAPLVLFARTLLALVALQLLLAVVWLATRAGPGAGGSGTGPFGALVGPWALFVWLRLIIGLGFPLVVSWAAVQTARSRSMESATGLLYINVGAIAAGTILAAGLYFGAGLLV